MTPGRMINAFMQAMNELSDEDACRVLTETSGMTLDKKLAVAKRVANERQTRN